MTELNESLQWAAIAFISIFVVGLTRQLGVFMTQTRQQKAAVEGPDTGRFAPRSLLEPSERERLTRLMAERGANAVGVVTVAEDCESCEAFLEDLRTAGMPDGAPLVVLSRASSPEHRRYLESFADVVVVSRRRMARSKISITPFCVLLDAELRVVKKEIATQFGPLIDAWRADLEQAEAAAADERIAQRRGYVHKTGGSA